MSDCEPDEGEYYESEQRDRFKQYEKCKNTINEICYKNINNLLSNELKEIINSVNIISSIRTNGFLDCKVDENGLIAEFIPVEEVTGSYKKTLKTKKKRTNRFKKGRAPINISKRKYLKLIQERESNSDKKNTKKMNFALQRKYCNCIEHIKFKTKKQSVNKSYKHKKHLPENNPYAICGASIYKNRRMKIPYKASHKCRKLYKKSTSKTKKSKSKSNK